DAGGSQRRRRHRGAGAAEPARRPGGRGRRDVRAHSRPRRRVFRAHRPAEGRNGEGVMTTLTFVVRDSATMTRRNLRHVLRYPVSLVMAVVVPVLLLLLF